MLGNGASKVSLSDGSLYSGTIFGDYDPSRGPAPASSPSATDLLSLEGGRFEGAFLGQFGDDTVQFQYNDGGTSLIATATFDGGDNGPNGDRLYFKNTVNYPYQTVVSGLDASRFVGWELFDLDVATVTISAGTLDLGSAGTLTIASKSTLIVTSPTFPAIIADTIFIDPTSQLVLKSGFTMINSAINSNGTISMLDGSVSTGLVLDGTYFGGPGSSILLEADLGQLAADQIELTPLNGDILLGTRSAIGINLLSSGAKPGAVNLIMTNYGTPLSNNVFYLKDGPVTAGAFAYNLYFTETATSYGQQAGVYLASAPPESFADLLEENGEITTDTVRLAAAGTTFQPYVPLYEAYPSVLLQMSRPSSLDRRAGARYDGGAALTAGPAPAALWGRTAGDFSHFDPKSATTGYDYDLSAVQFEAGLDGLLLDSAEGALIGGLTGHYRNGEAKISSPYGASKIHPDGWGLGATLTWFGENGFYADGQALATWYSSELKAEDLPLAPEDSDAFAYAFSAEIGQAFALSDGLSLTPQAQLAFTSVHIDGFTGAYSDKVDFDDGQSLFARLGAKLEKTAAWQDAAGVSRKARLYGAALWRGQYRP
ncbi:autotransporter outer membrane beta-barrel domain-containing protein [Martelella lutilitoris]|nr:autotransporter outer membrane beta-barrel domain-containing protein [Martelella lutilitoris]